MSEAIRGGEELSPSQQQQFIDKITALKPLLPNVRTNADHPSADELLQALSLYVEKPMHKGKFKPDSGETVEVIIAEQKRGVTLGSGQIEQDTSISLKEWSLQVTDSPEKMGETVVKKQRTYKIGHHKIFEREIFLPEYVERVYKKSDDEASDADKWTEIPTALDLEVAAILDSDPNEGIPSAETLGNIFEAIRAKDDFDKAMGHPASGFTVDHFNAAMKILDGLSPHNKIG